MLKVRRIEEKDWPIISKWVESREDWKQSFPGRDSLPDNGLGGVIVSNEDKPFAVGFLYFHPAISFIEWIMSDKEYKEDNRGDGIRLVIDSLSHVAKTSGAKSVMSISRSENLLGKFKDLGFQVDPRPSHECIKIL